MRVEKPQIFRPYAASDLAVTDVKKQRHANYTVHVIGGLATDGKLYMLDGWLRRCDPDVWIPAMIALARKWRPVTWASEAGVIRRAVEGQIEKACRKEHVYFDINWLPPIADKVARGASFKGWASMRNVVWPRSHGPLEEILEQCVGFPTMRYDDGWDALSSLCHSLDDAPVPVAPSQTRKKKDGYNTVKASSGGKWLTR